ncbi:MAG: DUF4328 domain-containing protein [Planctomycetota bacterium]|nr:MAG: DUF4328 domain-containing protein [Planctomycetota bacterium]REK24819.1 MAG: DUF4328 domain-containing protein [Planctomycetota bacterium]REK49422.1 MAG: DUF4328 domain-containing protein [Planctomycetota bacterium]
MDDAANPYRSPTVTDTPPGTPQGRLVDQIKPFLPGTRLATVASVLIAIVMLLEIVLVGVSLLAISVLTRYAAGEPVADTEFDFVNRLSMGVTGIHQVAFLVSGVAFLNWIYRAHRNLPSLGALELTYTPGWTVAYFFIPILNLFRPYQAVVEIMQGSDPGNVPGSERTASDTQPAGWWWTCWLIASFGSTIASRMFLLTADPATLIAANWIDIAASISSIVSGVLVLRIMRRIDKNQLTRHEYLQSEAGAAFLASLDTRELESEPARLERQFVEALLYGADLIDDRVHYYPDWAASMTREFGAEVEPRLEEIFQLAQQIGRQPRDQWRTLVEASLDSAAPSQP